MMTSNSIDSRSISGSVVSGSTAGSGVVSVAQWRLPLAQRQLLSPQLAAAFFSRGDFFYGYIQYADVAIYSVVTDSVIINGTSLLTSVTINDWLLIVLLLHTYS
jgi:hypothetical protein